MKAVKRPRLKDPIVQQSPLIPGKEHPEIKKLWRKEMYQIREAGISLLLDHPHICRMFATVLGENHFYWYGFVKANIME